MTRSKSLPDRPSLESLRKEAKKLVRDIVAGDAMAIARARVQLPGIGLPLTQRNAQLVIAREYGYAGWQELTTEVRTRLGRSSLEWAVGQARHIVHDNDVERLRELIAEYPALLTWQGEDGDNSLLSMATSAFGDSFDPVREAYFTRPACAELLIHAGAVVTPNIVEHILDARARGLLRLFRREGVLPRRIDVLAALGELDAVRAVLDENRHDLGIVNDAFLRACAFQHEAVASLLLERSMALDPELGARVDESVGRLAFVRYFIDKRPAHATAVGLWKAFVMEQARRAIQEHSGHQTNINRVGGSDLDAFVLWLQREPWLLGEDFVSFQVELIEVATLKDREAFIVALLDRDPALVRRQPPPRSQVFEHAFTYARTHLVPLLTRIWPLPDDLPHAAGMGNLAQVQHWFDESGAASLGDVELHFPYADAPPRKNLQWGRPTAQHVLDTAFAWAVVNRHFAVADFLLAHGANINTDWSSHEPASILHELVFHANYESMQFLIDRGIDMTIRDYRWNATAAGWARHAANDEQMAQWLEAAERRRLSDPHVRASY